MTNSELDDLADLLIERLTPTPTAAPPSMNSAIRAAAARKRAGRRWDVLTAPGPKPDKTAVRMNSALRTLASKGKV